MKKIISLLALLLMVSLVSAQSIAPLDCDKLFNEKEFVSGTEYEEYADICFYGTGYDEDTVTLSLKSQDMTYSEDFETSNGVLSSLVKGVEQFFTNVAKGVYRLYADVTGEDIEFAKDIIVTGETSSEGGSGGGSDENDNGSDAEVPEFSTIAAGITLLGAGLIIKKRRQVN